MGWGGGEEATPTATATPASTLTVTPTQTATPIATPTPAPTSTSTSGETLSDIYGVGTKIRDVTFDQVITAPGQSQIAMKVYWKNWGSNAMKFRSEMTTGGTTVVQLIDYAAQTMYTYYPDQNLAYQWNFSQAAKNPTENSDQIKPTYLGTETIDGKLCDKWQYTTSDGSTTVWVWKAESFPVKMETTTSSGTTTIEYQNIVFGTLSDSLFEVPAGVQVTQFPSYTP
jgi:outer membrane lipoprotein-sorting protein